MKRVLFFILVIGGILFVADFGLRAAAEGAAAKLIDKQIAARTDPKVGLGDFPFLLSMVTGRFDEVTVSIPRATQDRLVVEDIELTFRDVRLEALEVLGGRGTLRARSLRGRGVISEKAINDVIATAIPGASVEIEDGRVTVARDGVEVAATAIVANGTIFINAHEAGGELEIPLPGLMPEIQFSSLEPRTDELVLGVRSLDVRIRT